MKNTGITRPLDPMGRVVLPKELRKNFNWNTNDKIEISIKDDIVILKKYIPGCSSCGETNQELKDFFEIKLCQNCINKLKAEVSKNEI